MTITTFLYGVEPMKNIVILGSTGSIGRNALKVVKSLPGRFNVVGAAASSSVERLVEQASEFQIGTIALLDPAAAWRGRYTTEIGGLRHLRRAGFRDHIAHAESLFSVIPANSALPGDLGIVENPDGPDRLRTALGIVQGERLYVLRPEGLALLPVNFAVRILGVR